MPLNPVEKAIKEVVGYGLDVASNFYEQVKPALAAFLSRIGVAADVIEALLDENPILALTAVIAGTIVVAILGPELAAGGAVFTAVLAEVAVDSAVARLVGAVFSASVSWVIKNGIAGSLNDLNSLINTNPNITTGGSFFDIVAGDSRLNAGQYNIISTKQDSATPSILTTIAHYPVGAGTSPGEVDISTINNQFFTFQKGTFARLVSLPGDALGGDPTFTAYLQNSHQISTGQLKIDLTTNNARFTGADGTTINFGVLPLGNASTQFQVSLAQDGQTVIDEFDATTGNSNGLLVVNADSKGNLTVSSSLKNLRINLGSGNDTLLAAGAGTIVNVGTGQNTIFMSNDVLVTGATANTVIKSVDGFVLHGAVGSLNSESDWIVGPDGTRYGMDTQGDLLIKDVTGAIMTIANYFVAQQTAGIFVGRASVNAFRLLEPKPESPFDNIATTFKLGHDIWFTQKGFQDPLVLDLSGQGIGLTGESGAAPMFDMFGTGFAVHTGWVMPSTGILVMQNADGSVTNIRNLVGGSDNSGFAALAQYDLNHDGVIDANDPVYAQLSVWQDQNGDGVVDPGELMTLAQAGIASINVAATAQTGVAIAGNDITATGTFTRSDGTTGTIDDASFATDPFASEYLGDTTVSDAAAAMPNLKGYGTLTDLQVAMTLDPTLIDIVNANLPNLNQLDLAALRAAALPIFDAWARAVQLPDANGNLQTVDPSAHSDVPILVVTDAAGNTTISDFAYRATDAQGNTFWKLASGHAIEDALGDVIDEPTLGDVMAQQPASGSWQTFTGEEIGFIERYMGESLPIDQAPTDPAMALQAMTPIITSAWNAMNVDAVELAMQGPLASYFQGLSFDAATGSFHATTDQQLAPMYEAIFQAAPVDATGAASWLTQWKPIVDVVLSNLDRGQDLAVSYAYVFASMVHAYETVGFPLDIVGTAAALGVPSDMIVTGGSTLSGNGSPDIFYLAGGDQTVNASAGDDNFVMGGTFGHDVINAVQGGTSIANALAPATGQTDILRFTNLTSSDVTASRSGEDLILKVNGTDEQVTVTGQFIGSNPGLFGGDLSPTLGVGEVAFADGVVWDTTDIAWAVAPNTDGVDGTLIGTNAMDVLDGGRGNHFLSGGNGGDIYLYDRGNGADTIDVNKTNVLIPNPNYLVFGPGLTPDDVTFSRNGTSGDLLVSVSDDPSDTLTIQGQFTAAFTGSFGTQYFNQIQIFKFADGTTYSWQDVQDLIIANDVATPGATIYGFDSSDIIDPGQGAGDRLMSGGNGNDTYVFGEGYGNDTIFVNRDNPLGGMTDTVEFNPEVDPSTVQVIRNGNSNDVELALADGSMLTIEGQFATAITGVFGNINFNAIANFQFQDDANTLWTAADIERMAIAYQTATAGSTVDGFAHAIYGFTGDDTIDPGVGGNAFMSGGDGNDTYVFGLGYGHDAIMANQDSIFTSNIDTVRFNADVDPTTVTFTRGANPNDLVIALADGSELDVQRQFDPMVAVSPLWFNRVDNFQFQDAANTLLTQVDVKNIVLANEEAVPDSTINGFFGGATLDGSAGNETLVGWDGANTYVFGLGYGHETVVSRFDDVLTGHDNVVQFGAGITENMLQWSRSGKDLQIGIVGTSDLLTVENDLTLLPTAIQQFTFADGTTWSRAFVEQMMIDQAIASGAPTVFGFIEGTNTFTAGATDQTFAGEGGINTYVYSAAAGNDVIDDGGGQSKLVFSDINAADVTLGRVGASNDLVITTTATGKTITVVNQFNYLGAGTLQTFTFADGTVWTAQQVKQMLLDEESAAPSGSVFGYVNSNDTLVAGAGDKYLNGQGSADTYVYSSSGGNDVIDDGGSQSKLDFTDINSTDVSLATSAQDARNLIITDNTTGKTITVVGQFTALALGTLQSFAFADGVTWDAGQVRVLADADTVVAGTGDKTLTGRNRPLNYVYSSAGGNDVIADGGDQSRVTFLDINPSDVSLSRNGGSDDLIITENNTGRTLTISGQFQAFGLGNLQSFTFADGTVWTAQQVKQILLDQESAQVGGSIIGFRNSSDTLVAGLGDKDLNGLGGGDTYVYASNGGNDTVDDGNSSSRLVFSDINASDVSLSRDGASDNLVITDNLTGRTVTVDGQFQAFGLGNLQSFTFADGAVWTGSQVKQMLLAQESAQVGGGSMYGFRNSADTLVAGLGDKYLTGLGGSDTYVYASDGGNDVIDDGGSLSNLVFSDIDASGVSLNWPSQTNDLVMTVLSTGKTVTIRNQFSGIAAGTLQSFTFADGTVWTAQQVQAMLAPTTTNYVFDKGAGHVTFHPGSLTTITLGQDIAASDVALEANSLGDLTVLLRDTGETLTIDSDLSGQSWGIASVVGTLAFGDGTTMPLNRPWSTPFTLDWLGQPGNMTLTGAGYGNNTFELGPNDVVTGANGWGNTYDFATGDGRVTIHAATGTNAVNTLQMAAGITASDVTFESDAAGDLVVDVDGASNAITVLNDLAPQSWGISSLLGQIVFADGSSLSLNRDWGQSLTFTWFGGTGNMTLTGSSFGNNVYQLGPNDVINGANGWGNIYQFAAGDGAVTVNPAVGTNAVNTVQMMAGISASDVALAVDAAGDLIVKVVSTGDTLTLSSALTVNATSISSKVGQITFADGTVWNLAQLGASGAPPLTWLGTSGNDTAALPVTGATIDAGQGDDSLSVQGNGSDTFLFAKGDGHDTISNPGTPFDREDTLKLVDILPSEVVLIRSANALTLSVPSTGDSINLPSQFLADTRPGEDYGVSSIVFADGTIWNRDTIRTNAAISGTPGNDSMTLPVTGATVDAGKGDDYLTVVGSGSDTFLFAKGDGHDTIDNPGSGFDREDVLRLVDILPSEITIGRNANALVIGIPSTGDTVTALWQFWGDSRPGQNMGVSSIVFADGTVWDRDTIRANALTWLGTPGNDNIGAPTNGFNIDAGRGDDYIPLQGNGSDTILFAKGDGHDTIDNPGSGFDREDTLKLVDALPSDVSLVRSGNALLVSIPSTGDSINLLWQFWGDTRPGQNQGVSNIVFADGTVWTRDQIRSFALGSTGNDTLTGTSGNDTFFGSSGSDTMIGGGGYDTYRINSDIGLVTINNASPSGVLPSGEVDFGSGITGENLWFAQNGNDLQVDLLGTTKALTVAGWFAGNSSAQVDHFATSDELKLDSGLTQLVNAMATFSANNPGFNPTTATQMPNDATLQNVIASAWHA
jgi:Ca2+-binding RTX toxin-like protein